MEWNPAWLLEQRTKLGISLKDLCRELGVFNPYTVKAWEEGTQVPSNAYRRLLELFFEKGQRWSE